jgi:hypothetical protein
VPRSAAGVIDRMPSNRRLEAVFGEASSSTRLGKVKPYIFELLLSILKLLFNLINL